MNTQTQDLRIDEQFSFFEGGTEYVVSDISECDGITEIVYFVHGTEGPMKTIELYFDDTVWVA